MEKKEDTNPQNSKKRLKVDPKIPSVFDINLSNGPNLQKKPQFNQQSTEDDFENFVIQLQRDINLKNQEDFSPHVLELGNHPYHNAPLPLSPDIKMEARITTHEWQGPCGDSVRWYLEIQGDRITKAYYTTSGCTTASIASSQTAILMEGRTITEAREINDKDVLKALGKFPEADHHCATLAITSFNHTLDRFQQNLNN